MLESVIKEVVTRYFGLHWEDNMNLWSDNLVCRTDKGEPIHVVHLEFQKSLDKVPHEMLLYMDQGKHVDVD